ncbi:Pentatricopeptide repeat [Dillenia turbinata]|uniref:Pentatricopeptide repeat n=1 Tax=Dillenia turbinata TaxID=194707 RepID=A0AAN8VMW8_9MAGN
MPTRTVVSWNTMISGYSRWGLFEKALSLVSDMHCSFMMLNESTFSTVLSVSAKVKSLWHGKQVHCLVLKSGSENFEFVGSALLYFYCDTMGDAMDVLKGMARCGVVTWTVLIPGYSKREDGLEKVLELFRLMRGEGDGVIPNEYTLDCVIRVCGRLRDLGRGSGVHAFSIKLGFKCDILVGSALVEFYCNCEEVDEARRFYDGIVDPSLNASVSLIGGPWIGLTGEIDTALRFFEEIKSKRNPVTWNSMISAYIQNDQHEEAFKLYISMHRTSVKRTSISTPNVAAWTALINGYAHHDLGLEAILLFEQILKEGVKPNGATFVGLLPACSHVGMAEYLIMEMSIEADAVVWMPCSMPVGFGWTWTWVKGLLGRCRIYILSISLRMLSCSTCMQGWRNGLRR